MSSHTLQTLLDLKHKLEKLIEDFQNNEESINDCLSVLENFPITSELITQSGLGNVIASVRDKFHKVSDPITHKAQEILIQWKNIKKLSKSVVQHKSPDGKNAEKPHAKSAVEPEQNKKKQLLQESSKLTFKTVEDETKLREEALANEKRKFSISSTRRSIVSILVNLFKDHLSSARADRIALDIEEELNNIVSSETNQKEYISKAKMLSSSIKMNEALKSQIMKHEIDYKRLVSLSPKELASSELKLQREQLLEIGADSRRLDWYQKHEKEIKEKLGIDPNNHWDYDREDDALSEPDADPPDI